MGTRSGKSFMWRSRLALPLLGLLSLPTLAGFECAPIPLTERDGGVGDQPGSVTFVWTFGGSNCGQVPVARIVVTMTASNGAPQVLGSPYGLMGYAPGEFPCNSNNTDGVTLSALPPDTYSYTINAIDANRMLLYTVAGSVTVNGDELVPVTLTAVPTGALVLNWTFEGQSCAQAKVTSVAVSLNGAAPSVVPCTSTVGDGVVMKNVAAGTTYQIRLVSMDNLGSTNGLSHFTQTISTIVSNGASAQYPIDLKWAATGVLLQWTFKGATCGTVGVSSVRIDLYDTATGTYVNQNGALGVCLACDPSAVLFPYVWAGDTWVSDSTGGHFEAKYTVDLGGFNTPDCSGNALYSASAPITVMADQQPQVSYTVDAN